VTLFGDDSVKLDVLKRRAFNYRWAEVPEGVLPLTAADPDYPAPAAVGRAMADYIKDGYYSYTPKMGFPEFREALSKALWERKSEQVPPELILPIDSAARGMYEIAKAVLKPGDEMIVMDPVDYLFRESALAAGAKVVLFPTAVIDGKVNLTGIENYITKRTRMIGLCNPHNPLGAVYDRASLAMLLALCEAHDLYVMNDEIWSDIIFPGAQFTSILSLGAEKCRRVASVFGFSKSFGVAGLRIGCVYCTDEALFQKIVDVSAVMTTAGGISSISQVAGMACLQSYDWVDAFLAHLTANRDYAVGRIAGMPHLRVSAPDATYLLYMDISQLGVPSVAFTDFLLQNAGLALVPGGEKFFGPGSQGHMRLCFATSRALLAEGLNRLEQGLSRWQNAGLPSAR
jgi:cystathionine beta-lyase